MANAEEASSEPAHYSAMEARGLVHREQGDSDQAWRLLRENLSFAQRSGDPRRAALAGLHFASVGRDPEEVRSLLDGAAAELAKEPYNLAKIALWRGRRLLDFGRLADAAKALDEAVERAEAEDLHNERMDARRALADLARVRRDVEGEREHLTRALEIAHLRGFGAEEEEIIDRLEQLPPPSQ